MAFFPKIAAVAPKEAFSVWLHPAGKQRFPFTSFRFNLRKCNLLIGSQTDLAPSQEEKAGEWNGNEPFQGSGKLVNLARYTKIPGPYF